MNSARLALLAAICTLLAAAGCIERLPPRPPPEVAPYPQEKFDSPLNAWHQYQRAYRFIDPDARRPHYRRGPLSAEDAPQFAEYLRRQQPALAALDRALAAPYCVAPKMEVEGRPFAEFAHMRELARLETVRGRVLIYQGDTAGAVSAWLGTIELGHDVMQEGELTARLVGIAADAIGSSPLSAFVQQGRGTARDYREIIRRLSELDAGRFPYAEMLGREFEEQRIWMRRAAQDPAIMLSIYAVADDGWDLDGIIARLTVYVQTDVIVANHETLWAMLIEDARRPYPERDRTLTEETIKDPVNSVIFPGYSKARMRELYDVVRLRALVVMAALQWYRLDKGDLPPTLDALRPNYLAALPRDPYSERSYGYLRLPDGRFVVYSVGPDGKDDRAEIELEWPLPTGDGDLIFREGDGEPHRALPQ